MGSSPSKNNFILATWLSPLSSFLHGVPQGSVVTLLMSSGVRSIDSPLITIVAWILVSGVRDRGNYWATSSSYPLNFEKPHPIMSCEDFKHLGVLLDSHSVDGLPPIKPCCHLVHEAWGDERVEIIFKCRTKTKMTLYVIPLHSC